MNRVLWMAMLSSLLFAEGCCCPGPFFHCVGNHIFGPWTCGAGHGGGCGYGSCGDGCGPHGQCGDACGSGNACGCGHQAGYSGGCGSSGCGDGCGGGCSWYNNCCNSCCSGWGCGDIYLTDLFHPICDVCGWGHRHGHGACGGCDGGYASGWGCGDSCGSPGSMSGYGGAPCGDGCGCGSYAATGSRGPWTAAAGPSQWMAQAPQGPPMAQRNCSPGGYSMTAQAMRGPWETPSRGQWAMNRDYVVSQPKVVDDRVVESRPKAPAKKTVQASTESTATR